MPYKDLEVRKRKHAEYSKKHYEKNKETEKIRIANTKKEKKAEWIAYKATLKCTNCGFNHSAALDFHHIDPKTKEGAVHQFITNGKFARAYEEAKKCIVLCANCHRIHHYEERLYRKKKKQLKSNKKKTKHNP
jgi:hypothetical protein